MHGTQCNALSLTASASLLAGVGPGGTIVDSSDPSLVQFAGARNSTNDATYVYSSEYSSTASLAVIRRTTISTGATTTLAGGDMGVGLPVLEAMPLRAKTEWEPQHDSILLMGSSS